MQEAVPIFETMENSRSFGDLFKAGNREQSMAMARVASTAHRHQDMLNFMKTVVGIADAEGDDPTEEERGLLWEAYKNVVNALRVAHNGILTETERQREAEQNKKTTSTFINIDGASPPVAKPTIDVGVQTNVLGLQTNDMGVQTVDSDSDDYVHVASTEATDGDDDRVDATSTVTDKVGGQPVANDSLEVNTMPLGQNEQKSVVELLELYRKLIDDEICHICKDFVKLLDDQVHPQDEESKAYYLQIKADHLRYMCEVQTKQERVVAAEEVRLNYLKAQEIVKQFLPARHPTRLGLALNFAVFYCDILESREEALRLSREAVQDVAEEAKNSDNVRVLGLFDESKSSESEQLLSMLNSNIGLWSMNDDKENKGNMDKKWTALNEDSRG
ncbi:hypothetical protein L7F22_039608 [Adiantum nelumboides]|nr:hypothetical protein [Adiantum nelumboides]